MVIAVRALPAGHVLTRSDVRVARWPAGLSPAGAPADPTVVLGRRLAGPLTAREAVTSTRLLGRNLVAGLPGDVVAAAVPLADAHAVDLVRAGDRVDLLSAGRSDDLAPPTGSSIAAPAVATVIEGARVLAVFAAGSGGSDDTNAEVVLAVPRGVAGRIARESPTHVFTAVLAPP